ncbi:nucleoside recognition domain-containing protein [soil metagenome]
MLNFIWIGLIIASIICGCINDRIPEVVASVTESAKAAFELALGLAGIMTFWLGLMKIAEDGGLIRIMARALRPLLTRLFPDVPANHPAMGSMVLNITANMLGLTNAATPFGLRAMNELEKLNPLPGTATNAMCTFLVINTASIQLIPTTAIAYLVAAGATHPTDIIATALFSTCCATTAALITVKILEKLPVFRVAPALSPNPSPGIPGEGSLKSETLTTRNDTTTHNDTTHNNATKDS